MEPINPVDEKGRTTNADDGTKETPKESRPEISNAPSESQPQSPWPQDDIAREPKKDWWDRANRRVKVPNLLLVFVYTIFTVLMWCATREAAEAAKSSAETAKATLVAANRPWVGVDPNKPIVVGPIEIVLNGSQLGLATVAHVSLDLRNYGRSPALRIAPPEFLAILTSKSTPPENWNQTECAHEERESKKKGGRTVSLMPGAPMRVHTDFMSQGWKPVEIHHIWLVGCVVYQDDLGGPLHHTRILLHSDVLRVPSKETKFTLWQSDAD